MNFPIQMTRVSNALLIFMLLTLSTVISAQSQYWQYSFISLTLDVESSGILLAKDNGIEVFMGNSNIELSGFGKTLRNDKITGSAITNTAFIIDQREDLLFAGFNNSFQEKMEYHIYDKAWETLDYKLPIVFNQSYTAPFNKPVALKTNANSYFLVDDTKAYNLSIDSENDFTIHYQLKHGSQRMTDACLKDNIIYTCDVNGRINLFDAQGAAGQWLILDAIFLSIEPTTNGFLLTGEKDGKVILITIDNEGGIIWQKEFDGNKGWKAIVAKDNGIILTGENADLTGFVIKTNSVGELVWRSEALDFAGVTLAESQYGAIYALGKDFDSNGPAELIKLGPNGEEGEAIDVFNSTPLAVNNIEASIGPLGQLFFDGSDGKYFFPKDSNTTTVFAGGLWLGSKDEGGNIRVAAQQYFQGGDFQMGPIGTDPTFFQRIWSISQTMIEDIRKDLENGKQDMDWPLDYLQWPAIGNTLTNSDGEVYMINEPLAPFIDHDGDGLYNPYNGDYPKIKGEQLLWWVFNDNGPHNESDSSPMNLQITGNLYANSCQSGNAGYNTSFLDFAITNHSDEAYAEFNTALWMDTDLGCYTDDYIGCSPDLNAAYTYNMDAIDGQTGSQCPQGVNSFQDVPIQSFVFLNKNLDSYTYFNNPSVGSFYPGTIDPSSPQEFHYYMNNKWRDGQPLTQGNSGYDPSSNTTVDHAFPGDPSDPSDWSLCSVPAGYSDRRFVMSTNDANFDLGQTIYLNVALITTLGSALPCPNLDLVTADIEEIQTVFEQGGAGYYLDLGPNIGYTGQQVTLDAGAGAASYVWSNGSTEQTITVNEIGNYSVTVVDFYGCQQTDEVELLFLNSINDLTQEKPFKLFPNPTTEQFSIDLNSFAEIDELSIYSLTGKLLHHEKVTAGKKEFSTAGLSPGLYLVNIKIGGTEYTERLTVL